MKMNEFGRPICLVIARMRTCVSVGPTQAALHKVGYAQPHHIARKPVLGKQGVHPQQAAHEMLSALQQSPLELGEPCLETGKASPKDHVHLFIAGSLTLEEDAAGSGERQAAQMRDRTFKTHSNFGPIKASPTPQNEKFVGICTREPVTRSVSFIASH